MKIAFITQPWNEAMPVVGGHSSISILTYQIAYRLARAGHDIIIYAKKGHNQQNVERDDEDIQYKRVSVDIEDKLLKPIKVFDRIPHFRNPKRPFFASHIYYFGYIWQIARDLKKQHPDIIHVHNFSQFVPIIRAFNPQAKIALHMHCEWLSQLDPTTIKGRLEKTDLIIGCSDYITGKTQSRFPQLASRCQTIFNGVDISSFMGKGDENYPQKNGKRRILYAGRLSPEKGVHILLDAFKQVVERCPQVYLEIAGPPGSAPFEFLVGLSDDQNVTELASFYGGKIKTDLGGYFSYLQNQVPADLADRISFLGFVPHERLIEHYRQADVLVNPSLSEAFGMSLVEAMALETPVVAARTGGMVDIVEDGKTGVLVEASNPDALAEGILRLLSNDALRETMGKAGCQRVLDLFSWDRIVENLLSQYKELFC